MKKLLILTLMLFVFSAGCTKAVVDEKIDQQLAESVKNTMKARGLDVNVDVTRLKKLESPAGFYFYRLAVSDARQAGVAPQEQYLFFDGTYIAPTFINASTGENLAQDLAFEFNHTEINTTNISLMFGKKGAKNTIVKITDFECPYCRRANAYLETQLQGKDVAVYIVHLPLSIHKNAEIFAKVFETGVRMEKNFAHQLFSDDKLMEMSEKEVVEFFAQQSGDPEKFRQLVMSEEIAALLDQELQLAQELGVVATPVIFVNGKKIEGFNQQLIDRAIKGF